MSPSLQHDQDDLITDNMAIDELVDDDELQMEDSDFHASAGPPSPSQMLVGAPSSSRSAVSKPLNRRKRYGDLSGSSSPQVLDKSARKREQREREKEQQKQILNKLIEIFEEGGGTCAVQQGQKKFPWVDLPAALIRIGCYFAGWPEKCLPKMSDKHPDRIDASTGPSQWSLKQKRAMEAQINKGAVKVLPRPENRAVIFEIVDDFGNVKDSTVEFSENWVRNKLLGLGNVVPSTSPTLSLPATVSAPRTQPPSRYHQPQTSIHEEYSPPSQSLALPPIRDHLDHGKERLDLPSLSKMTTNSARMNGLHSPHEDMSRSPSPDSNLSESRMTHYPTLSHDDFNLRSGMLTLENGHGVSSLRTTSRPRSHHHHHPYSPLVGSSSLHRASKSRPQSPHLSLVTHHRHHSHSGITETPRSAASLSISPQTPARGPSPSSPSQQFPSHVPAVPSSVVAWDSYVRGWVLKTQNDSAYRALPLRNCLVFWHRETDEWECLPEDERTNEPGRALWNKQTGRWELIFEDKKFGGKNAYFPTHLPTLPGYAFYDACQLCAWVFQPAQGTESMLPAAGLIVWDGGVWTLNGFDSNASVTWSQEDKTWVFNMNVKVSPPSPVRPQTKVQSPSPPKKLSPSPDTLLTSTDGGIGSSPHG